MKMSSKRILIFSFLFLFGLLFFTYSKVQAAGNLLDGQEGIAEINNVYGGAPTDIRVTIGKIINVILGFLGVIFVVLTIFAGFKYMTAAGNEEETKKALALLKNAIIGLVIILMAWGITRYSIWVLSRTANNVVDYTFYPR